MKRSIVPRLSRGILLVTALAVSVTASAKDWYPIQVDVWDPPFNTERKRVEKTYVPLEKAQKRWNICVSIPHLKDAYWLAVNYGLVEEARRMGVNLAIYEAGGYDRLPVQKQQIDECIEKGIGGKPIDGLILSAISATKLNAKIKTLKDKGIPVLDLINGIDSPDIAARSAVDFFDTGFQAGEYLKKLNSAQGGSARVAWFPGPKGAAWVAQGDSGFRAALKGSNIEIIATRNGDTGKATQGDLISEVLDSLGENPADKLDYIIGTAVSAEAAVTELRRRRLNKKIQVLSYYYGPGVHQGIKRGTVLAAPTDSQAIQARIAIDMMVRLLEDKPMELHAAPQVQVIDRANLRQWDSSTTLAPRGFRPVFSVSD